ncbi:MAG: elongation factor G, partial [Prevotellaceae bacterium]|nr:elongation factor G [Prevotellaceae bacterium]
GKLSWVKVINGTLSEDSEVYNVSENKKERIGKLFLCQGKRLEETSEIGTGDVGLIAKAASLKTNDTITSGGSSFTFLPLRLPEPVHSVAVNAVAKKDDDKLGAALIRAAEEDLTFRYTFNTETKEAVISGMGELHVTIILDKIRVSHKIEVETRIPRVPYRETITKAARADYRHKKQSGGAGQFGEVHLIIEPYQDDVPAKEIYKFGNQEYKISVRDMQEINLDWGGKLVFINSIVGGSIDARFMPAILKGIMDRMEQGPLTGSYARDVRVIVYDGKMHPVDSNEISFRLAGRNAFAQAFKEAGPKLLEPIYDLDIFVPSDRMGDVMSDLQGRRGMVLGMNSERGFEHLKAKVPLKEVSSYSTSLSSLSGGRASFSMKFNAYELCPSDVQDKLIKEYETQKKEEE